MPKGLTRIGDYAFSNCAMSSVNIPNTVTSIGAGAFDGCEKLVSVTIPKSVTDIAKYTFRNCDKLKIKLPESLKEKVEVSHCASVKYY